ncbi:MAG: hypothetical protein OEY21_10080 [Nitrospira sp.]|nr:hypothetical protein [Nitrospira sp.]
MTDKAPNKKSIDCLIEIATNTKVTADRQDDQRRDFQNYILEERETHRLLDKAVLATNETIQNIVLAIEKTNLVVEKTNESLDLTKQAVAKMSGQVNKLMTGLILFLGSTVIALIVYIYTVLPHPT